MLPMKMARALSLGDARAILEGALDTWASNKSFQGARGVRRALGLIGCEIDWTDFNAVTGVDTPSELEFFTGMRNEIVHRGANPPIRRRRAQSCVDLTTAVARVINHEAVRLYRG